MPDWRYFCVSPDSPDRMWNNDICPDNVFQGRRGFMRTSNLPCEVLIDTEWMLVYRWLDNPRKDDIHFYIREDVLDGA